MLQRQHLCAAKTECICCKDKMYMLQRQNVYVIKTNVYRIKTKFIRCKNKFIRYKDKLYRWQRQNLYVVKTNKHGARAERARRGFFLPEKDIIIL